MNVLCTLPYQRHAALAHQDSQGQHMLAGERLRQSGMMARGGASSPPGATALDHAAAPHTQVVFRGPWQYPLRYGYYALPHTARAGYRCPFAPPRSIPPIHLCHLARVRQEFHLRPRWGIDRPYLPHQRMPQGLYRHRPCATALALGPILACASVIFRTGLQRSTLQERCRELDVVSFG